jgi:hypothetical protein
MKIKLDFAEARSVTDFVVGGDLGTVVLCKLKQAKWCLADIKGFILFTGSTRKSCFAELDRLIARGKTDEAAAEAAVARSVAKAKKSVRDKASASKLCNGARVVEV